jgi:multisubunit Na+/H+ antiporter MnhE subunit
MKCFGPFDSYSREQYEYCKCTIVNDALVGALILILLSCFFSFCSCFFSCSHCAPFFSLVLILLLLFFLVDVTMASLSVSKGATRAILIGKACTLLYKYGLSEGPYLMGLI